MSDKSRKGRGLGRGLSALMADIEVDTAQPGQNRPSFASDVRQLPVESLFPNPDQPRKTFSEEALSELADSLRTKGVIQPLIVRRSVAGSERYEIVAGERRWRAAQLAQLHEVPVVVRDFTDVEVLEVAIIENIQRADLNPVEEAMGFRQLIDRFGHTQEQLAQALGKSRSHVANLLRLLQLPDDVLAQLQQGQLSAGHARALITCPDPSALAREVIARGLSVRETERRAREAIETAATPPQPGTGGARQAGKPDKDADTRALEADLSAQLGMRLRIDHQDVSGGGEIRITYRSLDQLDRLCQLLSSGLPDDSI